ncbi:VOC family protein [Motiliproteus sp. SC1-56]|uniref:VOC family protein n=1 Tax=Motiliproteus sp. SC1-56 TaxID=2799565 RepID=UPI001A8C48E7|nr:VOC family protein [Motiliproteus sp. SC1-56]
MRANVGLDHISIAVHDLAQARATWEPVLGREGPDEVYEERAEQIKVARYYLGAVAFELMVPTGPDSEVARFLARQGEGIMVLSLGVESVAEASERLGAQGYPFIGGPRPFRDGVFTFIHPRRMNGVLLELIDQGAASPPCG